VLRFEVDPETLAALLSATGAHRVHDVRCVCEDGLLLYLSGVDSGVEVLGKPLPRLDVTLSVNARAVSLVLIEVRWELRDVAGLGGFAARLLPRAALTRKLVDLLTDHLDLEEGVEVHEDGTTRVHLDRLHSPTRPAVTHLRCERFDVPGPDGLAIAALFRMDGAGAR
jgi:hypothetical protein